MASGGAEPGDWVKAVLQLNKEDGFFKDAFYKILLPEDAKRSERFATLDWKYGG